MPGMVYFSGSLYFFNYLVLEWEGWKGWMVWKVVWRAFVLVLLKSG